MLSMDEAAKIALEANPDMKILSCTEFDQLYGFYLAPKDMKDDDMYVFQGMYGVAKDGSKHDWCMSSFLIRQKIIRCVDY